MYDLFIFHKAILCLYYNKYLCVEILLYTISDSVAVKGDNFN